MASVTLAPRDAAARQAPRFDERVAVSRLVVDARVVTDAGAPVEGLTAANFLVKIGGRQARVESATWVGEQAPGRMPADAAAAASEGLAPVASGRLIVFLFQKDLDQSRVFGLMRLLLKSRDLIGTLGPRDRIAVLSFDSRLRVWSDFTNDRDRLGAILGHDLLLGPSAPVHASATPSLLAGLSGEMQSAATVQEALEAIATALRSLPGAKSLVLVGHGFGQLTRLGVTYVDDYDDARAALLASRTTVFSLDVTDADYHSLETGLQVVAADTGGFYARTHVFPGQAMARLAGALAGYYVLFVEMPEPARRSRRIEVRLTSADGHVLASREYAAHDAPVPGAGATAFSQ